MLCERCQIRPATVHFTQITNGNKKELHLCEQCAVEENLFGSTFSVQDLLSGLLDMVPDSLKPSVQDIKCDVCGMTYYNFKQLGKFGCGNCYRAFSNKLLPILKKIHGSTQHVGKIPKKAGGNLRLKREIEKLKVKLNQAIKEEAYEKAAELRDKIRVLEKELNDRR